MDEIDQTTLWDKVKLIMSNKPWVLICAGITLLYYIVTGIQYWISDYMITTLKVNDSTVFISYATISVTGPVIGIVFGGNITTYLGGYTSKLVLKTALWVAISCALVALPIPFINNFIVFCVLLWFLLFFGGSVLPCLTGIMLNTVEQNQRTTANSMANLLYNLLGFLPSPFVYGAIYDAGDGGNGRYAMALLMITPVPCAILLALAQYFIKKNSVFGYN